MIAVVVPAIIYNKLHVETIKKLKSLFNKYVRASFYLALAAGLPWPVLCLFSKMNSIKRFSKTS